MRPVSQGPLYKYPIPLGDGIVFAYVEVPRELTRADAAKIGRVLDAVAFDDEDIIRWQTEHLTKQWLQLVVANYLRLWRAAPVVASQITSKESPHAR